MTDKRRVDFPRILPPGLELPRRELLQDNAEPLAGEPGVVEEVQGVNGGSEGHLKKLSKNPSPRKKRVFLKIHADD